jgi:hypothetical protein
MRCGKGDFLLVGVEGFAQEVLGFVEGIGLTSLVLGRVVSERIGKLRCRVLCGGRSGLLGFLGKAGQGEGEEDGKCLH